MRSCLLLITSKGDATRLLIVLVIDVNLFCAPVRTDSNRAQKELDYL